MKTYSHASRNLRLQKLTVMVLLFALLFTITAIVHAASLINNGDFETGDLTGWQPAGDLSVVTSGLDELSNSSLQIVANGNYSARIGDEIPWNGGLTQQSSIEQTVTVPSSVGNGDYLQFAYAIVANDPPDHPEADKPRFRVVVLDKTDGKTIYDSEYKYTSQSSSDWYLGGNDLSQVGSLPYHFAMSDRWVYRPWKQVSIPLEKLAGHQVTIQFEVRDCNYGAHPIYGYLDSVGIGPQTQMQLPDLQGNPVKAVYIQAPFWAPILLLIEKINALWLCILLPLLMLLFLLWLLFRRKQKPVYSPTYIAPVEEVPSTTSGPKGGIRRKMD